MLLAASETQHPVSSACRGFLQDVLEICHRVVLTDAIKFEWQTRPRERGMRPSTFSLTWLAAMRARKKVCKVDDCRNDTLREQLHKLNLPERDRLAIEEDLHLVEAAIATDYTVISRDDTVRHCLDQSSHRVGILRQVTWVNPVREHEQMTEWLQDAAEPRRTWQLGFVKTSEDLDA